MAKQDEADRQSVPEKDRRERAARWGGHLAAWKAGGLSQSEYCRRQGLKPADFSWWKYELARRTATALRPDTRPNPAQPQFIPVRTSTATASPGGAAAAATAAFEIVLRNGRVVRTGAAFDANTLARLLSVVELPC